MKNFLTFELLKILYWTDIDLNRPSDSTVPISKDLAQFQICENKNKKKKREEIKISKRLEKRKKMESRKGEGERNKREAKI